MYNSVIDIKKIQIDHTSRCNLACPQCARIYKNKINPSMPISDLTIKDYKIILEPFDNDIEIFHCGNFGDVISSPTFIETFKYCIDKVKKIKISTNGSLRNPKWWEQLAKLGKNKLLVVFSIDGLDDTNHLYRVNSQFKKIIENATSFINAGGSAEWHFIEFKHNYHQIEEAKILAKQLGFLNFSIKYTSRFADQNKKNIENKTGYIVKDIDNNHNQKVKKSIKDFDYYVNTTTISCKFKKQKSIFIDMNMNLWPCCWLGAPKYLHHPNKQTDSLNFIFKKYGYDFNNLRVHNWDILHHDFFQKYLGESWISPNEDTQRIYTCGRTCGETFEFSSGYGKNIKHEY